MPKASGSKREPWRASRRRLLQRYPGLAWAANDIELSSDRKEIFIFLTAEVAFPKTFGGRRVRAYS